MEKIGRPVPVVSPAPRRAASRFCRAVLCLLGVAMVFVICMLLWGGNLLVARDQIPLHADVAVVLQGSISAEKARIAGAVNLLQRGTSERILLSVPQESYWGQSIPPIARSYIERKYGKDVAAKVDFCETGPEIDSTEQEAQADWLCIQARGWKSIVIVTSDYHSRRARMVWGWWIRKQNSGAHSWVDGVRDPDFQQPWWRSRRSAKIWFSESLKLVWTVSGI